MEHVNTYTVSARASKAGRQEMAAVEECEVPGEVERIAVAKLCTREKGRCAIKPSLPLILYHPRLFDTATYHPRHQYGRAGI
jgi:hypothetical protein